MAQARNLDGVKVGVIVADGFEQVEFDGPVKALKEAGAEVVVIGNDPEDLERIRGVNHLDPAEGTKADVLIADVSPDEFDGLLIPGGAVSPDEMRQSEKHLAFVREFVEAGKPTAVICHGPWMLADSGVANGRQVTSWPAIRKDLERAGAEWKDQAVVKDGNLVTSRMPDDIPAFNRAFLEVLANPPERTVEPLGPAAQPT